jgi:hypothetical protein
MIEEIWEESSYGEAVQAHARKNTACRIARLALERRFGTPGQDILEALNRADEATLEDVILESSLTLEQVRACLGLS